MSIFGKRSGIHLPVVLTVLMVVGAGWSLVSEKNRGDSAEDVAARLTSFAAESSDGGEASLLCCPSMKGESEKVSIASSSDSVHSSCPGSTTSAKSETANSHCGGEDAVMSCPGSASSKAETQTADAGSGCCPGMSETGVAGEVDKDLADLLAAVKIPQVEE